MAWFQALSQAARKTKKRKLRTTKFTPWVESLESRDVPTATASLSAAGVLTVNGTSNNDLIVLHQSAGKVTIDGVSKSFSATSVNSLVINAGKGNDNVSLSGLGTGWTKAIRVTSLGGTDNVKLLDGSWTQLRGTNQALSIPASDGGGGGGGGTGDWFDANIHDAALRQLLRNDDADGSLSRSDMLAVFSQVESDGTVSSDEFNDLKAVANNTSLFGSFTYVTDLTRDVVVGNVANAHYQGQSLGNLAAGSSGVQLDRLVHKWFLGSDHPDAHDPNSPGLTITYAAASGTLFGASGPQYTDVNQGNIGDCYFVATLGELALRSPSAIQNMFIVNGDGTYTVRFFQNGVAHYVTVDNQLPTYGGGYFIYANMGDAANNSNNVLWVALAEKAYAQLNESGWIRPAAWGGGTNAYAGIEGGYFGDVTSQVANRADSDYYTNGASDETALANAWSSGKLIGFASKGSPTSSQIVGDHQYVVVGYSSTNHTVTLFNPWGINNGSQYPGLVTLTFAQLDANFDFWSVA